jgi:hypothetical protein
MKKLLCMVALGAICFGTVSASTPTKAASDTSKTKTKMTHGNLKTKTKTPHTKTKTKVKKTPKEKQQ